MSATVVDVSVRLFRTISRWDDSTGHKAPVDPHDVMMPIVSVKDSDGAAGYCLMRGNHLPRAVLADVVRPELMGQDPLDRERIWTALSRRQRGGGGRLSDRGLGYVDQALWDLAGRKLGVPVWKLIGGARDKVPAYASTMCGDETPGGLSTPEDYAHFATELVSTGYQAIKLHTWMPPVSFAPDLELDIRACQAVREAVGPDVELMLDPYHWYTRLEARKLGRALEVLDFAWLEEPMDESSISSYQWLAAELDLPVLGPEMAPGKLQTRAEWLAAGACDILRAGVNDVGGITPTLKIVHLAEAFGVDVEIHGPGSGNLAVVGGAGAGRWYERALLHPHFDYDAVPPHLGSAIDPMDADGFVHMPSGPGLGDDLDLAYIEENVTDAW